jgi:TP901 family phage tail tape measure protein
MGFSGTARSMVFELLAIDLASEVFTRVGDAAEKSGAKVEASGSHFAKLGGMATMALTGLAAGAGTVAVKSIEMAGSFQTAMERLHTQAGVGADQIGKLSGGVLKLAGQVGENPDSLAESLFHVESNFASMGITSDKALTLVKVAAEGARVGGANLVDVTNALTAAVASGIPGVQNMSQAMGVLNATVGSGDMKMQDLADAFGTGMVAVVKGYGLSITDVGAALATFGDNNIRGAQAGTELRMAVQAMAVPAKGGAAALKELGMNTKTLAEDMRKGGLKLALTDLVDRMKSAGISAKEQGQIITEMFGKKAGTGIDILVGQFDRLNSKYPAIEKSAKGFSAAWADTQKTFSQRLANMQQSVNALMIQLGQRLLPIVSMVVSQITAAMQPTSAFAGVMRQGATTVSALASGIGSVLLPAVKMLSGALLYGVVPAIASTIGFLARNKSIVTDVAKVITALLIPMLIKMGTEATINGLKAVGSFVKTGAAAVASGYQFMWTATTASASALKTSAAWTVSAGKSAAAWVTSNGTMLLSQGKMVAAVAAGYIQMGLQATAAAAVSAAKWGAAFAAQAAGAVAAGAKILWELGAEAAGAVASAAATAGALALEAVAWIADAVAATAAFIAENAALLGIPALIAVVVGAVVWLALNWKTVFNNIKKWSLDVYNFLAKDVIGPIETAFHALYTWLYDNFGQPVYKFFVTTIPNWFRTALTLFNSVFFSPWRTAFTALYTWVWNEFGQPIYRFFTSTLPGWVRTGMGGVKSAMGLFATAMLTPVNWVIQHVYDNGIASIWNDIAGVFHGPTLPSIGALSAPGFAQGGTVPVSPMMTNGPMAIVGEGNPAWPEYVIPTDPKYRSRAATLWASAGGDLQMLAGGGILGGIGSFFGGIGDALKNLFLGGLEAAARAAFSPLNSLMGKMPGSSSMIGQMLIDGVKTGENGLLGLLHHEDTLGGGPVVSAAKSQLGVPYSWGGGGPDGPSYGFAQGASIKGFDCSSLMQYAYAQGAHKTLPRTTYEQVGLGKAIGTQGDLQPGDLVFPFGDISHVMMVAAPGATGGAGMIEAPHTGAVVHMTSFYGMAGGARRILGYAAGGILAPGEVGLVGEAGPELVYAGPSGGAVQPLGGPGGGHFTAQIELTLDGQVIDKQLVRFQRTGGTMQSAQAEIKRTVTPSSRTNG